MHKLFSDYKKLVVSGRNYLYVCGAAYAAGIIFGVFFLPGATRFILGESVINFYVNAFSTSGSLWSLTFSLIVSDVVFIALFYGCSFIYYTFYLDVAFILYRGYILAGVSFIFIKVFGISGAFLYILCVLLHNVLVTAALSAFASAMAALCKRRDKVVKKIRNDLIIISAALVIAALIIELFLIALVLRPINTTF